MKIFIDESGDLGIVKNIKISHFDSHNEEGLQAVDFISWSIFRKYEMNDNFYYSIIQNKIETERRLFQ